MNKTIGQVVASLLQLFTFYVLWTYADQVEHPFIFRCLALLVMVIQLVALVKLWTKK